MMLTLLLPWSLKKDYLSKNYFISIKITTFCEELCRLRTLALQT